MRRLAAVVLALGVVAGCSNNDKGGTTPTPTATTGAIKGVATLGGAKTGNAGIVVGILGGGAAITDDAGNYAIGDVAPGSVTIQAQYPGYQSASTTTSVTAGQVATPSELDLVALKITPKGGASGHVYLFDTANAAGSMITLSSNAGVATSATDGSYSFANLPAGVYDATFTHNGYVSQTLHNISVGESGSYTIPDVTLSRSTTTINGHTITTISTSPDWTKRLLRIDGVLTVVNESDGAGTVVGQGTTATNGQISADDRHVYLTDNGQMLWLVALGGAPVILTTRWNGDAFFSPDGSHLIFNTNGSGTNDYYAVPSTGGTPTLLLADANVEQRTPDSAGLVLSTNPHNDAQNLPLFDLVTIKTNAGAAHRTNDVFQNINWFFTANDSAVFTTSTGVNNGTSTGDLYYWNASSEVPLQLSGGASALASVDTTVNTFWIPFFWSDWIYVFPRNFDVDDSYSHWAVNVSTGALKMLLAHNPQPSPITIPAGQGSPIPSLWFNVDMHDNNGVYSYDLYTIDLSTATATMLQADAGRLFGGPGQNDNVGSYVFPGQTFVDPFDQMHWIYMSDLDSNANTANLHLFDGKIGHKLTASVVGRDVLFNTHFSRDYRVVGFASPGVGGPTPLTIENLPAQGTAGDAVPVPIAGNGFAPGFQWTLSLDGSTAAWVQPDTSAPPVSRVLKMPTAASATPVTPSVALADPTAGRVLNWLGLSADGAVAFAGDRQSGANAWAQGSGGTLVELDAAGLGGSQPLQLALAGGMRTFITDESGDNFVVQVDSAATPTVTKLANYVNGQAWVNGAHTRFFYTTSTPTLEWVTATANGSTAGTWQPLGSSAQPQPPYLADPSVTYFHDGGGDFSGHVTAYDGATGVVPLALDACTGASFLPNSASHLALVDRDTNGVNHLVVSPKAAPARLVLADGYQSTQPFITQGPNPSSAFFYASSFADAPVTLYSLGDANAGSGNPPSWTLKSLSIASSTITTVATNVDVSGNNLRWNGAGTQLLLQTEADPLLGTFTVYTSPTATGAVVDVSDNVVGYMDSQHQGNLAGMTLSSTQGSVFTALPGQAGVAVTSGPMSSNLNAEFSGDESRLFLVDAGAGQTGVAYGVNIGAAGIELDTDAAVPLPDMTGGNVLFIARHPTDPGFVIDHANMQ